MPDAYSRWFASSIAAAIAESATLPTDIAKVRLQVQGKSASETRAHYTGMADCILRIAREEGFRALWRGYLPALVRQVCYTSLSLVLYEPVRNLYAGLGEEGADPLFLQRLLAGGTAGAVAIAVFNPTEVLKTRAQTSSNLADAGGGALAVARQVLAKDGLRGFWAGVKPNIARTFLVNAAELGTYDQAKSLVAAVFGAGLATQVVASGAAGVCSACASTPADVVKTRLMNSAGRDDRQYSNMCSTLLTVVKEEGPFALYKGFVPIVIRKILWCTVFFVFYEHFLSLAADFAS